MTSAEGAITRSYYNMEGDLLQVTDANGRHRLTKYDNLHRAVETRDPFKGQNTFAYDANGRLKRSADNKGTAVEYEYDALGRMTVKRFPSGREIKYLYDLTPDDDPIHTNGLGRLAAYEDPSGTTRFGYDTAGRLIAAQRNSFGPVHYEYDYTGQATALVYPSGYTVSYQYELGGLTKVSDAAKTLATYTGFNALGLHTKAIFGNGATTDYAFDPRSGRLAGIRVNQGQLLDLAYTYDQAGNISAVNDRTNASPAHPRNVTETYVYDRDSRLISATGPYGAKSYTYDAMGNFLSKEGVYYSYTDPARPYAVTEGSDGFRAQYDDNGNMVAKTDPLGDEFVYSYDEDNQLVKSVKNGNHVDDFTYDANGMRVRKTAGGAVTDYFYDGVNLLYEATNGTGKNHVWANGTLLCTVQNNSYTYYHTDHLGTSKLQTDGQGKVLSIDITKPYGPVAREGVMSDTFSDLSKIDPERSRFQYDAATGTILPPTRGRGLPKQVTDNHEVTVEKTAYERVKNIRIIQTASDQINTELKIEFDFVGKARLTVKNKAGDIVFQDEYSGTELKTKTIRVEVGYTLNQAYTIILELAARNASTPSRSTIFSVSWGEAEAEYGFIRSLPVTFATDVYAVKLNLVGTGVTFYLNTGGKLWQRIEPGQETILDQPDRTLTIRAYLTLDEGTNLQSYGLEINPYHDMSFTGKFLEPEIGLAYFGGRWYEPGIGRWVTVDPVEDGDNWYDYCRDCPTLLTDPNGEAVPLLFAAACFAVCYWLISNEPDASVSAMLGNAVDAIVFSVTTSFGGGSTIVIIGKVFVGKYYGAVARQAISDQETIDYNSAGIEAAISAGACGIGLCFGKISELIKYKLKGIESLRKFFKPSELNQFRTLKQAYPEYFQTMNESTGVRPLSSKEVKMIRPTVRTKGHHQHPLAFGGKPNPGPRGITPTTDTRYIKDPAHIAVTNFWNSVLRRVRAERGIK